VGGQVYSGFIVPSKCSENIIKDNGIFSKGAKYDEVLGNTRKY